MNHAATAYFFHVNKFLNPTKIINMNTNNKSLDWWNYSLSPEKRYELSMKHFEMPPLTINNAAIEELYGMYGQEPKKEEQSPYIKEAIRQHTNDVLAGIPYIHMTPENEETYIRAFLVGAAYGIGRARTIIEKPSEAPTVFLQDEKKKDIKIELTEENEKTLHY